jgi:DinB superfamily
MSEAPSPVPPGPGPAESARPESAPQESAPQSPAEYAAAIDAARQRLLGFVRTCPERDWQTAPLDGDPRPVGVVIDHVAHSYAYLANWMREILAGHQVPVNSDIVDGLNAEHAQSAARISPEAAIAHLSANGDAIVALVAGLSPPDLDTDDGRIRRIAQIAIWHADNHRTEIQEALAAR